MTTAAHDLRLRLVAFLPWGDGLNPVTATTGPLPGAGAIEIAGPRRIPTRTWLKPSAGPAGVSGRFVDPDGRPRALAVGPGPSLVALPSPPLALAPRTDGVWSPRDGTTTADVAWSDPFDACAVDDRLCGWDAVTPTGVLMVAADGSMARTRVPLADPGHAGDPTGRVTAPAA